MQWGNIEPLAYHLENEMWKKCPSPYSLKFLLVPFLFFLLSFTKKKYKKRSYKLCILHCRASEWERIIELNHVLEFREIYAEKPVFCVWGNAIFSLFTIRIFARCVSCTKIAFWVSFSLLLHLCLFCLYSPVVLRYWHILKIVLYAFTSLGSTLLLNFSCKREFFRE